MPNRDRELQEKASALDPCQDRLVIKGGYRLQGTIRISGAKNAALPAMAACLLTAEDCVLENVPEIEDVRILCQVLEALGVAIEHLGPNCYHLNAAHIVNRAASSALVKKMRASFLVMGPLLARFGEASSCAPGGDVIGQRPIDVHLAGFAALGASLSCEDDIYTARSPRLRGTKIFMDYPSHIGTENVLMAATLAEGRTILLHASQEPEVVCLAAMLNQMGARISGAGTSTIVIDGVPELHGTMHWIIPDRIEAGTFALAGAIARGTITLENVECAHLESLLWKLSEAGVAVQAREHSLFLQAEAPLRAVNVQALPYPGFATDLQAAIGVLLTQAHGTSIIHERVYDNRLLYVQELRKMGAEIEVNGQTAVIRGPRRLLGTTVRALDIRSGAALVLAGLAAEGRTEVLDLWHLDRGYEGFDDKLRGLGARVWRKTEPTALK